MPDTNKTMNMAVDIIPVSDGVYKLGDATHQWIINGIDLTAITDSEIDDMIEEIYGIELPADDS